MSKRTNQKPDRFGDRRLVVDYVPLSAVRPDPANPRTHPKKQQSMIEASVRAFGFVNPLLLDEADVIIAGHGRYLVAKNLGLADVPVIRICGLSDHEKQALRIADNKIALASGWDVDLLRQQMVVLSTTAEVNLDVTVTGFSSGEIDVLLTSKTPDPQDAIIPACPDIAATRPGDIWVCGEHRLGCGDCRDEAFLSEVMDGAQADAAFLDPPYNVKIQGHAGGKGKIKHREFAVASGELRPSQFIVFLKETLGSCAKASRDGAVHFICMDHRHMEEIIKACSFVYDERLNMCVWNKSNAGMGSLYRSKHELVFVYRVGDAPHFNAVELGKHGRNRTNVWDYGSVNTFTGHRRGDLQLHPTVKPTGLVADAIQDVTRRGEVVLDGFMGSGATLMACERTGRLARGVELDPAYVDVAVHRWMDATGRDAVLAEDGRSFRSVARRRTKEAA